MAPVFSQFQPDGERYRSLNLYLKKLFGEKVYKVTLNGGMTCPNRDGHIGTGGCIFCSRGGSGEFAGSRALSIKEQIDSQIEKLGRKLLTQMGLAERIDNYPHQLSGGQCQRVAIARAIVGNPEIILADEPTGNLDSKMGAEVMELLHKLNKEDGRTIVMVTHNEEQAKQTSRTIRFFDGRQVQ